MCGCLSHAPYWGPGLKPRRVPWLGIEHVTASQAGTQSSKPHEQGQDRYFILLFRKTEQQFLVGACGLLFNTT